MIYPMTNFSKIIRLIALSGILFLSACIPADQHMADVSPSSDERITVAAAQSISEGMSSAEVIDRLGPPNILSKDETGNEVWVYDKVSTQTAYSGSSFGANGGGAGLWRSLGGITAGALGLESRQSAGASTTSQRSLSVVIRFSNDSKVTSVAYRASRF